MEVEEQGEREGDEEESRKRKWGSEGVINQGVVVVILQACPWG